MRRYVSGDGAVKWFKCYLFGRTHVTKINNVISDPQADSVGVPQGSILGPLLFVLYINYICNCIDDDVFMNLFADDTLISVEDCDVERACQRMNGTLSKLED